MIITYRKCDFCRETYPSDEMHAWCQVIYPTGLAEDLCVKCLGKITPDD